MEITTPSEPKPRLPRGERPAKLDRQGNPAQPRPKPREREAAPAVKPALPRGGQVITIGRDGKVRRDSPAAGKPAIGKPVQRVNRSKR